MKYSYYYKYKKSNDKLMINIPEHWSDKRLRFILSENLTNGLFKKSEFWGEGRPIINVSDVYSQDDVIKLETLDRVRCDDSEYEKFSALEGDFFFVRSSLALDGIGKTAIVRNAADEAVFECHLVRGRPNKDLICPVYLNYYLNSKYAKDYFKSAANLVTMATIDQMKLKDTCLLIPSYIEQQKIAIFLDYKTQQIDQLIEKKRTLIEKLEEKRIAVITLAVTKGIDKKAELKSSGVDWLGDVPRHWDVMKLGLAVRMKSGMNITSLQIQPQGTYPVYGGNGIRGYFEKYTNDGDYVLIGRQGALCGNVKFVEGKFWASEHAVVVTPDRELSLGWLYHLLFAMNLNQYSVSAAQPGLSVEMITKLKIPFPPVHEQLEQLRQINIIEARINPMLSKVKKAIDTLEEYRSAIITSAVTGKIDVREVEVPKVVA